MKFWLHRFRKLDMTKKEHRQMLIDAFINPIFPYDDKMLITFNYKEGTKTITLDDVKNEASKEASGSDLDCRGAPKIDKPRLVDFLSIAKQWYIITPAGCSCFRNDHPHACVEIFL